MRRLFYLTIIAAHIFWCKPPHRHGKFQENHIRKTRDSCSQCLYFGLLNVIRSSFTARPLCLSSWRIYLANPRELSAPENNYVNYVRCKRSTSETRTAVQSGHDHQKISFLISFIWYPRFSISRMNFREISVFRRILYLCVYKSLDSRVRNQRCTSHDCLAGTDRRSSKQQLFVTQERVGVERERGRKNFTTQGR
jgi:hypothetical protein